MLESSQPQPLQPGGSQPGDFTPPPRGGIWQCLAALLVVMNCQGMLLASEEARDAAKMSYNALNGPTIKACPTQNVNCAGVERPCSKQGCLIRVRGPLEGPRCPSRNPDSPLRSEAELGI